MDPAFPSHPPPPPDGGHRSEIRPLSAFGAALWSLATTSGFLLLLKLVETLRAGASSDLVSAAVCQVIAYLLGVFFLLRLHAPEASIREFLGLRATHPAFYPLAVLLGAAIEIPANALFELILKRYPMQDAADLLSGSFADASLARRVLLGVVAIALGPMVEEIFFRGAVWKPVRRSYAGLVTAAITGVVFALAHLDWHTLLPITLVGITLGALRAASGSLAPSLLAHMTFNAIPFYALVRSGGARDETPIPPAFVAVSVAIVVALLALVRVLAATDHAKRARRKDNA